MAYLYKDYRNPFENVGCSSDKFSGNSDFFYETSKSLLDKEQEGRNKMSFGANLIFPERIYFSADSRSTINSDIYRDNINKIVYIPVIETVVTIIGVNSFYTEDNSLFKLEEMIRNYEFSENKENKIENIELLISYIFKEFKKYNIRNTTELYFFTFINKVPTYVFSAISSESCKKEISDMKQKTDWFYIFGALYGQYIWRYNIQPCVYLKNATDEEIVEEINLIYDKIKSPEAQKLFNNYSIGGETTIAKLTPDGFVWL